MSQFDNPPIFVKSTHPSNESLVGSDHHIAAHSKAQIYAHCKTLIISTIQCSFGIPLLELCLHRLPSNDKQVLRITQIFVRKTNWHGFEIQGGPIRYIITIKLKIQLLNLHLCCYWYWIDSEKTYIFINLKQWFPNWEISPKSTLGGPILYDFGG